MFRNTLLTLSLIAPLAGCMTASPEQHFVSKSGNENFYEFGVVHAGSQYAFEHQRDNYARQLCPNGHRIVSTKHNQTRAAFGTYVQSHYLITIACPA